MTTERSVDDSVHAVARLRDLCRRLPHIPTEHDRRLLVRFEQLAASPGAATTADTESLVIGWRAWWRAKRLADIRAMADSLSSEIVESDRWLATYALAARTTADPR